MRLRCPQIRKTLIELPFDDRIDSYLDLSRYIVGELNLEPHLKAIPYNKKGQPFFYNLDLMHSQLPKLDFSEQLYITFTASPSFVDEEIVQPVTIEANIKKVSVTKGNNKYTVEVDLDNTLSVLKYKLFKITRIHPKNQILKFANKPLINDV